MESPFAPFSGGDFLPPATTSGGMADDSSPPCSRCGFGGCDLRVAGCGCLLHTVSTLSPLFSLRRNWYKPYVASFPHRRKPEAGTASSPHVLSRRYSIQSTSNPMDYMLASKRRAVKCHRSGEKRHIMCQFCDTSLAHDPFHSRPASLT